MSYHDHEQHDLLCSLQEEIANVRSRMEFIVVASNDRQKELESTWSTVKNLDESVQSLTVQIKQRRSEIEALLSEDDPKNLSRRVKVTPVHVVMSLNRLNESFVIKIKKKKEIWNYLKKGQKEGFEVARLVQELFLKGSEKRGEHLNSRGNVVKL